MQMDKQFLVQNSFLLRPREQLPIKSMRECEILLRHHGRRDNTTVKKFRPSLRRLSFSLRKGFRPFRTELISFRVLFKRCKIRNVMHSYGWIANYMKGRQSDRSYMNFEKNFSLTLSFYCQYDVLEKE